MVANATNVAVGLKIGEFEIKITRQKLAKKCTELDRIRQNRYEKRKGQLFS